MPKEENNKSEKIEEKTIVSEVDRPYESVVDNKSSRYRSGRLWIIGAIVILIIVILVLIGSMFVSNNESQGLYNRGGMTYFSHQMGPRQGGSSFFFSSSNSNSTSTSSTSVVSGVVTAVNGSSFDVGGGGSKTTVNTNGSTTWNTTDKKVSVNDSVIVYGTVSGSTITATSIQINNL
jgi:hypothetical protein